MNLFPSLGYQFGYTGQQNRGAGRTIHAQNLRKRGAARYNTTLYHGLREDARKSENVMQPLRACLLFCAVTCDGLRPIGYQFGYIWARMRKRIPGGRAV